MNTSPDKLINTYTASQPLVDVLYTHPTPFIAKAAPIDERDDVHKGIKYEDDDDIDKYRHVVDDILQNSDDPEIHVTPRRYDWANQKGGDDNSSNTEFFDLDGQAEQDNEYQKLGKVVRYPVGKAHKRKIGTANTTPLQKRPVKKESTKAANPAITEQKQNSPRVVARGWQAAESAESAAVVVTAKGSITSKGIMRKYRTGQSGGDKE